MRGSGPALAARIGPTVLPSPVMTASGTCGYGIELAPYVDLASIGAVVVKSLSARPWPGNPPPRLTETPAGMLNAVGLQGPGVQHWIEHDLPALLSLRARVVASIWGRSVEEFREAARLLRGADVVAVEVNLSCPNVESRDRIFAHSSASASEAVHAAAAELDHPVWAKLSPNVTDLVEIAAAVHASGAAAVTLINTVMGMAIDLEARSPRLGRGGGGLSGPAIHPIAVRAVWDVHEALPELPIVGAGGVSRGEEAVELILAGASAVQVGTASFAEPGAVGRVQAELEDWCHRHGVGSIDEIKGSAHG